MKTLLTTSAILIATTFSAQAETLQQAINTAVSEYLEESIDFEPTAAQISNVAANAAAGWNNDHSIAALHTAYDEIDTLQDNVVYITGMYNNLADSLHEVENAPYRKMGDVFATEKLTALYQEKNASYDPGSSSASFGVDSVTGASILSNVTLSGKYHNFSINTDITANTLADRVKLETLIHVINDKAYNEGYKDGFNDGFEMGFNKGYSTAVYDMQSAASPL